MIKHRNLTWDFVREMLKKLACISTLTRQVEKLAHRLARWHANLKYWHTVSHVDTFFWRNWEVDTLLVYWAADTLVRKPCWHASTFKRWHVNLPCGFAISRHLSSYGTWFSKLQTGEYQNYWFMIRSMFWGYLVQ